MNKSFKFLTVGVKDSKLVEFVLFEVIEPKWVLYGGRAFESWDLFEFTLLNKQFNISTKNSQFLLLLMMAFIPLLVALGTSNVFFIRAITVVIVISFVFMFKSEKND